MEQVQQRTEGGKVDTARLMQIEHWGRVLCTHAAEWLVFKGFWDCNRSKPTSK